MEPYEPYERIAFVKVIADVIKELEEIKERLELLEIRFGLRGTGKRQALADMISDRFSAEEIDGLAFALDLNGDYHQSVNSRSAKARELVIACDRRSMLPDLVKLLRSKRPRTSWPVV